MKPLNFFVKSLYITESLYHLKIFFQTRANKTEKDRTQYFQKSLDMTIPKDLKFEKGFIDSCFADLSKYNLKNVFKKGVNIYREGSGWNKSRKNSPCKPLNSLIPTIPIMQYIDNLSKKNGTDAKPTKFIILLTVSSLKDNLVDTDETLRFGLDVSRQIQPNKLSL